MKFDSATLIEASILDPLRAFDVLSGVGAFEIERLREVNAKVLASVESAPGSGLRKRLKAAQEAQAGAERRHDTTLSYLRKGHELMDGYRADIKTLSAAIANAIKVSPDLPPVKLAEELTSTKWKQLALDEVARRADALANAVYTAVKTYARSSL